jgi:hypothetical protein
VELSVENVDRHVPETVRLELRERPEDEPARPNSEVSA